MSRNKWLIGLRSSGVLVSEAVLNEVIPEGPPQAPQGQLELVRQAWSRFEAGTLTLDGWLRALVYGPLAVGNKPLFALGADAKPHIAIPEGLRSIERPNGALLATFEGKTRPRVLVWKVEATTKPRAAWDRATTDALRLLRELREQGLQLGLVTDGRAFRLLFVGVENEAWLQWDATRWFAEEAPADELDGFTWLLHQDRLGLHQESCPLIDLAQKSRRKQADIADVAGTRIRRAVEHMLSAAINTAAERAQRLGQPHPLDAVQAEPGGQALPREAAIQAIYQAAIRVAMRIVVVSYAEARQLFPLDIPYFVEGYGVSNLHDSLRNTRGRYGETSLKGRQWAWPRLLGLFDLVYHGSKHPELKVPAYGGQLFRPGDPQSEDAVLRALALFEEPRALTDADVLEVLELVRFSDFVQNIDGKKTKVPGPVDFLDLRTEYIGIMYEGLLDYSPVLVSADDGGYVELKGKGFHAYPLKRLETLAEEGRLKEFIKAVREGGGNLDEDEENEEEGEDGTEADNEEDELAQPITKNEEQTRSRGRWHQEQLSSDFNWAVNAWAQQAVLDAKLAGPNPDEKAWDAAVDDLVQNIYPPGAVFLMSWKGLRKGSGTYYTRPALVIPLVQRTLEPLLYDDVEKAVPKKPSEIIALKVCDPAMGSGSFLVASAALITRALHESWHYHGLVERLRAGERLLLPAGEPAIGVEEELLVEMRPSDRDDESSERRFDEYLTARLKRHVIEHCLYGVDINPLAVELAKISMWIETMDRDLPFEFLDHKLREGNSLVGAWLGEAFDYPIAAWGRYSALHTQEAAGKDPLKLATVGARDWLQKARGTALKDFKKVLGPGRTASGAARGLRLKANKSADELLPGLDTAPLAGVRVTEMHRTIEDLYARIHALPEKRREEAYHKFRNSEEYRRLRHALDRWCALWFWPTPGPRESVPELLPGWFYSSWPPDPADPATGLVEKVRRQQKFFHWSIEFPDVFLREKNGFDAVVGNPPWDKIKPESVLFFTRQDPLFPTYGKQQALDVIRDLFEKNPLVEKEWADYTLNQRSQSKFYQNVAQAFAVSLGEKEPKPRTTAWYRRIKLKGDGESGEWYRDEAEVEYTPYRPFTLWRGGRELNYYKIFTEQALRLIHANGGRKGMVLPGAISSDLGAKNLRNTFLERCQWEWLYSFENKMEIFPVHRSYIFCCNIVERGGRTETLKSAFMVHDVANWARPGEEVTVQERELIKRFSPLSLSPLQPSGPADVRLMEAVFERSTLIKDFPYFKYTRELDTSGDSKKFIAVSNLRAEPEDPFGRRYSSDGTQFLPLYKGEMFFQFDPARDDPKARRIEWPTKWWSKRPRPEAYIETRDYVASAKRKPGPRFAYRRIAPNTNERTFIAALLPPFPTLDSVFLLRSHDLRSCLNACLVLDSLVADFYVRHKTSNMNLSEYVLSEFPLPKQSTFDIERFVHGLLLCMPVFATEALVVRAVTPMESNNWSSGWVWNEVPRLSERIKLEVAIADQMGIDREDLAHLARHDGLDPRGFHRIDDDLRPRFRYPALVLAAYDDFLSTYHRDLTSFVAKWRVPEDAIDERDSVRGPDWRGWNPEERLPKQMDERERIAIHVHRDELNQFLSIIHEGKFPQHIVEPYARLWETVWAPNPNKVVLTWDDCYEYARCMLVLTQPEGAWERFQEVLRGMKPYRYIYDSEVSEEPDSRRPKENGKEGSADWGSLRSQREIQRKLKEFTEE